MPATRVLHVLHSMNCGGAETLIMNIYRSINRDKIQFDFLVNVFDEMYYEKEIEKLGGKIYRMKFLTAVTPPIYERNLYKFFKSHPEFKIVHSHLETTTGIILKQAKKAGVPMRIAHSHNTRYTRLGAAGAIENIYKSYCKTKIVPNATHRFACSEPAAKWLFGETKAEIINNGIQAEAYAYSDAVRAEVRQSLYIADETKVLIHVGRFCDQKNHEFLIDIFDEYHKLNCNSVLVLIGAGELMDEVKSKVHGLGLNGSVMFLGLRNDVYRLLQAADCFVFPSKFEGLPVSVVEAQAADLPCFISDKVPQETDLGITRFWRLPTDNPSDWAERIFELKSTLREPRCAAIAEAGFDIKTTADKLTELYCNI